MNTSGYKKNFYQSEKVKPKPKTALEVLIDYLVLTNPRGLQKKIYQTGGLAFFGQGSHKVYLQRNALRIAQNGGANTLFEIHPDKDIILELFAAENTAKNQLDLTLEKSKKCTCSQKKELENEHKQTTVQERYFYIESKKNGKIEGLSMSKTVFVAFLVLGLFFLLRNKF